MPATFAVRVLDDMTGEYAGIYAVTTPDQNRAIAVVMLHCAEAGIRVRSAEVLHGWSTMAISADAFAQVKVIDMGAVLQA